MHLDLQPSQSWEFLSRVLRHLAVHARVNTFWLKLFLLAGEGGTRLPWRCHRTLMPGSIRGLLAPRPLASQGRLPSICRSKICSGQSGASGSTWLQATEVASPEMIPDTDHVDLEGHPDARRWRPSPAPPRPSCMMMPSPTSQSALDEDHPEPEGTGTGARGSDKVHSASPPY